MKFYILIISLSLNHSYSFILSAFLRAANYRWQQQ